MKKVLMLIILIVLFLTGCGKNSTSKRLVCTQKVSVVDINMIVDFEDDGVKYWGLKYIMSLDSDKQVNAMKEKKMCEAVKTSMMAYADAFINCKQEIVGKEIIVTADFDFDKMSKTDISKKTSIEEATKIFELQNYICTVTNK